MFSREPDQREDLLNEARCEGRDWARDGGEPEGCPYPPGTGEYRWWHHGYNAESAQLQAERLVRQGLRLTGS